MIINQFSHNLYKSVKFCKLELEKKVTYTIIKFRTIFKNTRNSSSVFTAPGCQLFSVFICETVKDTHREILTEHAELK